MNSCFYLLPTYFFKIQFQQILYHFFILFKYYFFIFSLIFLYSFFNIFLILFLYSFPMAIFFKFSIPIFLNLPTIIFSKFIIVIFSNRLFFLESLSLSLTHIYILGNHLYCYSSLYMGSMESEQKNKSFNAISSTFLARAPPVSLY